MCISCEYEFLWKFGISIPQEDSKFLFVIVLIQVSISDLPSTQCIVNKAILGENESSSAVLSLSGELRMKVTPGTGPSGRSTTFLPVLPEGIPGKDSAFKSSSSALRHRRQFSASSVHLRATVPVSSQ